MRWPTPTIPFTPPWVAAVSATRPAGPARCPGHLLTPGRADALLQDYPVVQRVGTSIRRLVVDEYQGTGHVQERVPLRLDRATAV